MPAKFFPRKKKVSPVVNNDLPEFNDFRTEEPIIKPELKKVLSFRQKCLSLLNKIFS